MRISRVLASVRVLFAGLCHAQRIEVTVPATRPLHGHLVLVFAKNAAYEPRMQLEETYTSAQGFGVDVDDLDPGQLIVVDASTFGYLPRSLADLTAILKRDWPALWPKLEGKLHIDVGDGGTYFLNNAVHLLEKQLDATRNPHADATFQ